MLALKTEVRGAKKIFKAVSRYKKQSVSAMETAVKRAGFVYKNKLQDEIRKGAPGGKRFKELTHLAGHIGRGAANRTALRRLSHGIRYSVKHRHPFTVAVGFTNYMQARKRGGLKVLSHGQHGVSGSWMWLGDIQQEGFSRPVTEEMRRYFRKRGLEKMGWRKSGKHKKAYGRNMGRKSEGLFEGAMPFFLKKSTTHLVTPPRPIIEPFFRRYRSNMMRDISNNFRMKMNGMRI